MERVGCHCKSFVLGFYSRYNRIKIAEVQEKWYQADVNSK